MIKNVILFASIAVASGILFTNVYTSIVDARSWGNDIPRSIETARIYFTKVNPGNFFRIFSPLSQLLALAALILFWKAAPGARPYLGAALALYVIGDALTFAFFYPRNEFLFKTLPLTDIAGLKKAWSEWNAMNWMRSAIILVGLVCSFVGMWKGAGVSHR